MFESIFAKGKEEEEKKEQILKSDLEFPSINKEARSIKKEHKIQFVPKKK